MLTITETTPIFQHLEETTLQGAFEIELKIAQLKEEIAGLECRKDIIIRQYADTRTMSENGFHLLRKTSTRRTVDQRAVKKHHPEVWEKRKTVRESVTIADLAKDLSQADINDICEVKETVKYEIEYKEGKQ